MRDEKEYVNLNIMYNKTRAAFIRDEEDKQLLTRQDEGAKEFEVYEAELEDGQFRKS